MSLPLLNSGGNSRRRPEREDESVPAHHSDLGLRSDHGSRLSDAAAATMKNIPPEQGLHRGPRDTETHVSHHSRDDRSQSPNTRLGARSEGFTQRTPFTIKSFPPSQGSYGVPPDTETHVPHHSQDRRSESADSRIGSRSEAATQHTDGHGPPTRSQARSGEESKRHRPDVVSHHSRSDRSPFYNSRLGDRSEASSQRRYSQGPSVRFQTRSEPGSRRYHPEEVSSAGYVETSTASEPRAPSVSTGTRYIRASQRRRQGCRLLWRRREAPRSVQQVVVVCTIALLVLVILLIILECDVFRKKSGKPQTS
jgi:hypothetical protein